MATYSGLICLSADLHDPLDPYALRGTIDRALAPHRAGRSVPFAPGWTSWRIHESAPGTFPSIPGGKAHQLVSPHGTELLRCAGGPRGLLDLEAVRSTAAAQASAVWNFWQEVRAVYPPPSSMAELRAAYETEPSGHTRARLEAEYQAQPAIEEIHTLIGLAEGHSVFDTYPQHSRLLQRIFVHEHDLVQHLECTESELIAAERSRAMPTDVLITLDGRWIRTPQPPVSGRGCFITEDCFDLSVLQPHYDLIDEYLDLVPQDTLIVALYFKF